MISKAEQAALGGKANSVTHNKEYQVFIHKCASRKKFPPSLSKPFRSNKREVLNVWLQNKKTLSRCAVAYCRRATTRERARNRYGYRKLRNIRLMYPGKEEVWYTDFVNKKEKAKLAEDDPECPGQKDERMFWLRIDTEMVVDDEAEENVDLHMEVNLDEDGLAAVTGEDGVFGEGIGVLVAGMDSEGGMAFHEELAKQEGLNEPTKPPKTNKMTAGSGGSGGNGGGGGGDPKDDGKEPLQLSAEEEAVINKDRCLDDAAESDKLAMQLEGKQWGAELKDFFMRNGQPMRFL